MMKGEDDDDMSEDSFQSKTVWQRFQVIFAGPFFNFILAFIIALFVVSISGASLAIPTKVSGGAKAAGLRPGDEIVQMGNKRIHHSQDVILYGLFHQESPDVSVTYKRDGKLHTTTVTRTKEDNRYILGVSGMGPVKVSPIRVPVQAFYETKSQIDLVFDSLRYLFSGRSSIKDVSGPVGIVTSIGSVYDSAKEYGFGAVLLAMASFGMMLSANLGVMNLIPFPALDGGRIFMLLGEAVTRKRLPTKVEAYINAGGLAILLGLITLITIKDLVIH